MGPLQRAQNHLVLPGTAESSHHRGDLAMRSHPTGKEKAEAEGSEVDYTDTLWFPSAIKNYYIKDNTCTYTLVSRSRRILGCCMTVFSQGEVEILRVMLSIAQEIYSMGKQPFESKRKCF